MATKNGKTKTARKTARRKNGKKAPPSPKSGVSLPLGNHPGNTGGKKGRSGRRPLAITAKALEMVNKHDLIEAAKDIALKADKETDRLAAIRFLVEYAAGKPRQAIDVTNLSEQERLERLVAILTAAQLRLED